MTKTLAAYLVKDGINVNCIGPGVFESKMTFDYQLKDDELADIANKSYPVGRYGNETDMASLAIYLSSKASAFMTGGIFYLDGGSLSIVECNSMCVYIIWYTYIYLCVNVFKYNYNLSFKNKIYYIPICIKNILFYFSFWPHHFFT